MIEWLSDAYRFNFTIKLLVAELVLLWGAPKRPKFPLRVIIGTALYIAFSLMFPDPWGIPIIGSTIIRCAALGLMLFLFEADWRKITFVCVTADILENLSLNISLALRYGLNLNPTATVLAYVITMVLCCGGGVILLHSFFIARGWKGEKGENSRTAISLVCAGIHMITESLCYMNGLEKDPYSRCALAVADCLIIGIQFLMLRMENINAQRLMVEHMLNAERERYRISKSNLDLIIIKYHDMKHQLAALKEAGEEERNNAFSELEDSIESYDTVARTGNDPLDTILTEKMPFCKANDIDFTYMVDASRLEYIASMDVYSLFGNAIDNAIEAVMQVDKPERSILMRVNGKGNMTVIHIENTCNEEPKFENGVPVTQKGEGHGYGTLSIKYIAEKYNGTVSFSYDKRKYILDILLQK